MLTKGVLFMKKILLILLVLFMCLTFINADDFKIKSFGEEGGRTRGLGMKITGIIFISIGSACLISGIALGVYHQLDPENCPGSIPIMSYTSGYYRTSLYINPIVLSLNLTGIVLLAIGIPLTIVGSVRMKKSRRRMNNDRNVSKFKTIIPDIEYNITHKNFVLGARIYL